MVKSPVSRWEDLACRKDVRFRDPDFGEIPKLEQVKFSGPFLRDGLRSAASRRSPGLRPELFSASLVQISLFFGSVHPPPLMPRWATALNFVIPSVAEGPAVRPSL